MAFIRYCGGSLGGAGPPSPTIWLDMKNFFPFPFGSGKFSVEGYMGKKVLYSSKAVASVLCVTERRVRQLRDDKIISEYSQGLYDLIPTVRNYIRFITHGEGNADSAVDLIKEKALLMRAKRQNEEFDLNLKAGKLHESEEIELVMNSMLMNFRSRLMAIPTKAAPVLAEKTNKAEINDYLTKQIKEALEELSDFDTMFSDIIAAEEDGDE